MIRSWRITLVVGGLCLSLAAMAAGQENRYRPRERDQFEDRYEVERRGRGQDERRQFREERTFSSEADRSGRERSENNDRRIATLLAQANKAEIRLGRYAQDRANSSDVREFAERLAQDHEQMLSSLRRFAPEAASMDRGTSGRSGGEAWRSEAGSEDEDSDRRARSGGRSREWNDSQVSQQIHGRFSQMLRDELSEKDDEEFDHCFVGQQAVLHHGAMAKHHVLRQYASSELREVIDEAIEILEGHQGEVETLVEQLKEEHQGSARGETRDSEQE